MLAITWGIFTSFKHNFCVNATNRTRHRVLRWIFWILENHKDWRVQSVVQRKIVEHARILCYVVGRKHSPEIHRRIQSCVVRGCMYMVKNRALKMFYGGSLPQDVNVTRASITKLLSLSGNSFVRIWSSRTILTLPISYLMWIRRW